MSRQESVVRIACLVALAACILLAAQGFSQSVSTAYRFKWRSDGAWPMATMVADSAGNLYGTTFEGGGNANCGSDGGTPWGCGTVFELTPPAEAGQGWTETILYSFTNGADGANPAGGVVFDQADNLYGVTNYAGANHAGTVYQLKPPASGSGPWTENTIYNLTSTLSGYDFPTYLVFDKTGNLYGYNMGYSFGSVFQLSPPAAGSGTWTYEQIYSFNGPPNDGGDPLGGLALDSSGNLYGVTNVGGSSSNCAPGCGTVFRLAPPLAKGGSWKETVLYNFQGQPDANYPEGGVLIGKNGNLFGTTHAGGANGAVYGGYGTVFELAKPKQAGSTWVESVLYSFESNNNGAGPLGTLIQDGRGNVYGMAVPIVFELSPPSVEGGDWTETTLYNFVNWPGLGEMVAGLARRTTTGNSLYGVTQGGGICNTHQCNGTVFSITP